MNFCFQFVDSKIKNTIRFKDIVLKQYINQPKQLCWHKIIVGN